MWCSPEKALLWASIPTILGAWLQISHFLWEKLPPFLLILVALGIVALGAKVCPRDWVSGISFGLGIAIAAWRLF
jgi:hypothetical protein